MAAPTLVATAFVAGYVPAGSSQTTASIAWQTDDVVVAVALSEGASTEPNWAAPTTGGSGISFGAAQRLHASTGSEPGGAIYACIATQDSSGTFTHGNVRAGSVNAQSIQVYVFRGSLGIGNSNLTFTTGTPRTTALTLTGADGAVVWGTADWSAGAVVSETPTASSHSAASPGPSAVPQEAQVGTNYTYYFEVLDDQPDTGSVGYGVTGNSNYLAVAIEVKAGEAGPNTGEAVAGTTGWAGQAVGTSLAVPGNFTATVNGTTEIDLDWDAVTGAQGYHIYRDDVLVHTTDAATTAWNDTGLDPATEYCYRVAAWD